MFEQSFVRPQSRARTGWTVMVSTGLQVALIGAAIVIPLLSPDLLPRLVADAIVLAPPGPPPGRAPIPEGAVRPRALSRRPAPPGFYEPVAVPRQIAQVIDEPDSGPAMQSDGVPNGLPATGPFSPVLSSLIKAAHDQPPPEKPAPQPTGPAQERLRRITVGGVVQQGMLLERVQPVYPPMAIQLRIQGTVSLRGIIGPDGRVRELIVVSGHPILAPAAVAAVSRWRYRPTLLNGEPVEVVAPIEVHFTLGR